MTDPRRLNDERPHDVATVLLRHARDDEAPAGSRAALLGSLGIGAAITTTAASVTATQGTAAAAAKPLLFGSKWIALCALGGIALGGLALLTMGGRNAKTSVDTQPITAVPAVDPAAIDPLARDNQAASVEQTAPAAAVPPSLSANPVEKQSGVPAPAERLSAKSNAASSASKPNALDAEVAALDRARKSLESSDPNSALHALSAYDRKFRSGTLGPEAQVLRIEALLRRGDRKAAAALARQTLKAHPASPHAQRVRSLLREAFEPPQ